MINERPRWVPTKCLNEGGGIGSVEWVFDDSRVAQQDIQFDQNQFANGHLARCGGERREEGAGVGLFRAVAIEGIEQEIGIEGDHQRRAARRPRTRLGGGFVGEQAPIFRGRAERAERAAFRELPFTGRFRQSLTLPRGRTTRPAPESNSAKTDR